MAIRVRGLVQGVGFRPTVWRLARDCGLTGEVWNDAEGVMIRAWGRRGKLDGFLRALREQAPPLARVDAIEAEPLAGDPADDSFHIASSHGGGARTGIAPDAATCDACLAEMRNPAARRYRYPFTNCTHCGPRLSIVRAIPYDRANTSMAAFAMCPDCGAEYLDPGDRRFHAQPLACPACGPRVWLERMDRTVVAEADDAIAEACARIGAGDIVAVKGIGGFHLACDATDAAVVARLRARKHRDRKPFALMAPDIAAIRRYCAVGPEEEDLLRSPAAPIVLLAATGPDRVADDVAPGRRSLGFMLPYTPLHRLLLEGAGRPIVLTSGNRSEEPQCTGNDEARRRLASIADVGLFHDRDIVNRADDSVARVIGGEAQVLRRARGYAPAPIVLPEGFDAAPPVLALGGELKNTFCLVKDGQAILSQHIGDLADATTSADYRKALTLYRDLFDFAPAALVVDRHPEYLSGKLGREWAMREHLPLHEIQHHHAHVASCMAENRVPRGAPPVLGIALDGLGYGDDGTFWGGEFLLAGYTDFRRLARFGPVVMPGGAQAVCEPWRSAFAHLDAAVGWDCCQRDYAELEIVGDLSARPIAILRAMMAKGINSPAASSCGRLFDAVAAVLGLARDRASYEGEAAVLLEASVDGGAVDTEDGYPFAISGSSAPAVLESGPMWRALLADLARSTPAGIIAARFHRGLADAIVAMAGRLIARDALAGTVALSGGAFQNLLLLERVAGGLRGQGFTVLAHRQVPPNDGGLALGQAAIAAARLLDRRQAATREVTSCA